MSLSTDKTYRAAIVCASDRSFQGLREDISTLAADEILVGAGYTIIEKVLLPDECAVLSEALARIADDGCADLIITTGGTGLSPRDVIPEATAAIIDRLVPGIPEALRAASMKITLHGMLSRGIAGIRKKTLIVNLPGSPKAVRESLQYLLPVLDHALLMLSGGTHDCAALSALTP